MTLDRLQVDAAKVEKMIAAVRNVIEERDSGLDTGGMNSKLEAAMLCQRQNIETWIVNGALSNFFIDALDGKISFTKFKVRGLS